MRCSAKSAPERRSHAMEGAFFAIVLAEGLRAISKVEVINDGEYTHARVWREINTDAGKFRFHFDYRFNCCSSVFTIIQLSTLRLN